MTKSSNSTGDHAASLATEPRWALAGLVWLGAVIVVTLFPFEFSLDGVSAEGGRPPAPLWHVLEPLLNIALFVPAGYLLARSRILSRGWVVTACVALSCGVEAAQSLTPARVASFVDVIANTSGAIAGVAMGSRQLWRRGHAVWRFGCVGYIALASLTLGLAERDWKLADWNPDHSVLLGNEVTGGRAYLGSVLYGELCVGPSESERCHPVSGQHVLESTWRDRAELTQSFRLSVVAVAGAPAQSGPARLLTWSADSVSRNVTLGQEGRDAVLRIRRFGSNANGTWPSLRFPGAFEGQDVGDTATVTVSHRRGVTNMTSRVGEVTRRARFGRQPSALLDSYGEFIVPTVWSWRDALIVFLISAPLGALASASTRHASRGILLCGSCVALAVAGAVLIERDSLALATIVAAGSTLGVAFGWWMIGVLLPAGVATDRGRPVVRTQHRALVAERDI